MKQNRAFVAFGALAAVFLPAIVVAQVARFSNGNVLDATALNTLVDAVNGQAAGAPGFVESVASGANPRTYTARGDGMVTFVPAGNGVQTVTTSLSTNVEGTATTIGRAFTGNSVSIGVRNNQQFTLTVTSTAGAPTVGVFWIPMRGNAPEPTF